MGQSALQFLIEELKLQELADKHDLTTVNQTIDKAIDMEKQQIQMAFNDGKVNSVLKKKDSEQYYNDVYGK